MTRAAVRANLVQLERVMVISSTEPRWALILAGGDGRRLRPLTRQIVGDDRPKQFCPVLGGESLLEQTRRRVATFAPGERVLIVLVDAHERFYAPLLTDVLPRCLVIQPENRGTAPAILYGLLRLTTMTPVAPVALFPSDHYVSDDRAFIAHVEAAAEAVRARPDLVVLLGITPDTAEVGYGWIEPGDPLTDLGLWSLYRVLDFWEKPSAVLGEALRARGCLWNSFVIVAYPSTLIALYRRALPSLVDEFLRIRQALTTTGESASLRQLYAYLPSLDFSHNVLASRPPGLAVLPVTGVAWCDLGEPGRVAAARACLSAAAAQPGRGGLMSA